MYVDGTSTCGVALRCALDGCRNCDGHC